MIAGCFGLPFAALIFATVKRSVFAMCIVAFTINTGVWINKYLMVVPALSPDNRPFEHWIDIALALGLLAGFLATIVVLARRLPVYADWDMRRES